MPEHKNNLLMQMENEAGEMKPFAADRRVPKVKAQQLPSTRNKYGLPKN